MPNPKPTPDPEPIIELVDHLPIGYVILAFVAGAAIVAILMVMYGDKLLGNEDAENAG